MQTPQHSAYLADTPRWSSRAQYSTSFPNLLLELPKSPLGCWARDLQCTDRVASIDYANFDPSLPTIHSFANKTALAFSRREGKRPKRALKFSKEREFRIVLIEGRRHRDLLCTARAFEGAVAPHAQRIAAEQREKGAGSLALSRELGWSSRHILFLAGYMLDPVWVLQPWALLLTLETCLSSIFSYLEGFRALHRQ